MAVDHRTRSLDDEGYRKKIHPTETNGFWKKRRTYLQYFLIVFFLSLPWLSVGGRPFLRLNIFERRFSVLGVMFQSHDVPLFFLFLMSFALLFAFMTALFGRVWCGWGCPQTVFIEAVYRRIEGWIEGPAFERRKKESLPLDIEGFFRLAIKWSLFVIVTLVITHSFLALFMGPENLWKMILAGPVNSPRAFLFIVVSSAVILFDFGWFREQFCIVMCPYGRIQSVFQDTKTFTVAYDSLRGEPRRGSFNKGALNQGAAFNQGDCVDCSKCVAVCPTGVDIRNGSSQLECIACAACIDACDDVMLRLNKPKGLIGYHSLERLEKPIIQRPLLRAGDIWLRGRSYVYGALLCILLSSLFFIGSSRKIVMVEVFKNRGEPYINLVEGPTSQIATPAFGNLFIAEIASRIALPVEVVFEVLDEDHLQNSRIQLIMPNNPIRVEDGQFQRQPLTIKFSKEILRQGKATLKLKVKARSVGGGLGNPTEEIFEKELVVIGPL